MMPQEKQANKFIEDYRVVSIAILGITAIEIAALFNGINGAILTIAVAAIAGLAGWTMPQLKLNR